MTKIKDLYVKIGDKFAKVKAWEDGKKHKAAKIISFFVGAFFDLFGVIIVAIWKYLFCSKEENSKYCVRLSIFGMILKCIIFTKLLFATSLPFFANAESNVNKGHKYYLEEPFSDDDFFNFSFNVGHEIDKMHKRFERQNEMMNAMFREHEKEMKKIEERESKNINFKKEVKTDNGYETTTVEKTGPNIYSKSVNIRYVGNGKNSVKENNENRTIKTDKKVNNQQKLTKTVGKKSVNGSKKNKK